MKFFTLLFLALCIAMSKTAQSRYETTTGASLRSTTRATTGSTTSIGSTTKATTTIGTTKTATTSIGATTKATTTIETTTRATSIIGATPETTTTEKSSTTVTSEEAYAMKIEELANAKTRYGSLQNMRYLTLADGNKMPVIALGTALMDNRLIKHVIEAAIDLGYRAFDTAFIYGMEKEIGEAIKNKIDDGTVKREDLFIISKLWSTFHRTDLVEVACNASLEKMGLKYFDLYLIHNPMSFKEGPDPLPMTASGLLYSHHDYLDAWRGMEGLKTKGLVKSIGVSNFNSKQLQRILVNGTMKPVINQVESHPYLTQEEMQEFCQERNITLSCFGVLGSKGTPAEYKSSMTPVIDDSVVKVAATALQVTPAQLLIKYQIQNGRNVVVKASSPARMWENLQSVEFVIDPVKLRALNALNKNKRTFTFKGMGDTHPNYPFLERF